MTPINKDNQKLIHTQQDNNLPRNVFLNDKKSIN
jgi:hypothetical protein